MGLNLSADERVAMAPLIAEVRDLITLGRAAGHDDDVRDAAAAQLRSMRALVKAIAPTGDTEADGVDRRAVAAVTHLAFRFPKPDVRAAILRELRPEAATEVDRRLDLIDRMVRGMRQHGPAPPVDEDLAPLVRRMTDEPTGIVVIDGPAGTGKGQLADRAAQAWARRWDLRIIRVAGGGRDPDLPLDTTAVLAELQEALHLDTRITGTHADRAAEIRRGLRRRPLMLVLDALPGQVADAVHGVLALPPGRSRAILTTSDVRAVADAWRLPPLTPSDALRIIRQETDEEDDAVARLAAAATASRFTAALAGRILSGAQHDATPDAPSPSSLAAALHGVVDATDAVGILLRVAAAAAVRPLDGIPAAPANAVAAAMSARLPLAVLAYAPSDQVAADVVIATALGLRPGDTQDPPDVGAADEHEGATRGLARMLLHRMELYGLLARDDRGAAADQPDWMRSTRPAWTIAHPLLRRVARGSCGLDDRDGARLGTAVLDDLIRRAAHHATTMTLPIMDWPTTPAPAGVDGAGWYRRHEDELIEACLRAGRMALPVQCCALAELVVGHLERQARWADLDAVTRVAVTAAGHPSVSEEVRARLLLHRGMTRLKVHRAYDVDGDVLSHVAGTSPSPDVGGAATTTPAEAGATQYFQAARVPISALSGSARDVLGCWLAAFEVRTAYSRSGATLADARSYVDALDAHAVRSVAGHETEPVGIARARAAAFARSMAARVLRRVLDLGGGADDFAGALEAFRQAAVLWRMAGDDEGVAYAAMNQSRILRALGGPRAVHGPAAARAPQTGHVAALAAGHEALEIFSDLHHARGIADAHHNLGRLYRHLGRTEVAMFHLTAAAEMFDELADSRRRGDVAANVARTAVEAGHAERALDVLPAHPGRLPSREQGYVYVSRARAHVDLGHYDAADVDYARALDQWADSDDAAGEAHILHNWAVLKSMRGDADGLALAVRAAVLHDQVTDPVGKVYAVANLAQVVWRLAPQGLPRPPRTRRLPTAQDEPGELTSMDAIWLIHMAGAMLDRMALPHANGLVRVRTARYLLRIPTAGIARALGVPDVPAAAREALDAATATNAAFGSPRLALHIDVAAADLAAREQLGGFKGQRAEAGRDGSVLAARYDAIAGGFQGFSDPAGRLAALHRAAHAASGAIWCDGMPLVDGRAEVMRQICAGTGLTRPSCT